MTLTEQADSIILQNAHTDEDIKKLQILKWRMSKLYDECSTMAGMEEQNYNLVRTERYIKAKAKAKETGIKYTEKELEAIAKNYAEENHGGFRTAVSRARGIKYKIDSIQSFCVTYWTMEKNKVQASNNVQ